MTATQFPMLRCVVMLTGIVLLFYFLWSALRLSLRTQFRGDPSQHIDVLWTSSFEMDLDRTIGLYRPDGTLHRPIAPPVPVLHRAAGSDAHAMAA